MVGNALGDYLGPVVVVAVLVVIASIFYRRAHAQQVTAGSVNDDWQGAPTGRTRQEVAA